VPVDGITTPVKVEPGQFITGRFAFHKAMYPKHKKTNANPLTVWRWLIILDQLGNITLKSNNKYSLITVLNWDIYQGNGVENVQQTNNNCSAGVQQTNTNKNDKNDKNIKEIYKESFGEFKNVRLTPEELEKLKTRFPDYLSRIESLSVWMKSNGKTKKDHYATILNWARRDEKESPHVLSTNPAARRLD